MTGSPKASLVERLVQGRLRSGELEASAAHLLQLGEGAPGEATRPDVLSSVGASDAGMNLLVPPPPIIAQRGTSLPGTAPPGPSSPEPPFPALSPGPATIEPAPLVPISLTPDRIGPDLMPVAAIRLDPIPLTPIALGGSLDGMASPPIPPAPVPMAPITRVELPPPSPGQPAPALVPPDIPVQKVTTHPDAAPPLDPELQSDLTPAHGLFSQQTTERTAERPDLVLGAPTVDAVALERGGMVDWSRTRSRISEEFRLVQRQILRAAFGPGAEPGFSNLLLVTSARPGEGKSFTSLNLAGSIARQGDNHVLLIDADSKRDSFCYALGLAENRGLLDLVANPKLDPSPLIVKTPIDRLSILPVGRERERSAELFSTKEMTRLIQSLGRRYADRLLILDAPPCLSTSDPAVLAPVVGQILFVVEADRTQRDEVEASLDLIQACPNITLVLNKQQISSRYTFGAYSSYYSS
jgi:receptor protein-tyrosine kinase